MIISAPRVFSQLLVMPSNRFTEDYYIPPIILNKKPLPTEGDVPKRHVMVCVDGKQRLSSVQAFVNGMIPCHDYRGQKW